MFNRREFLAAAGTAAAFARVTARKVKVEKVFDTPGPRPNGLQMTSEGLWILDQGDNRAYLVRPQDGSVLRALDTESDRGSGITFDGDAIWIASTYDRTIIRADARTGRTLTKYFTPGAGVIYRMVGDAPQRTSPLAARSPAGQTAPVGLAGVAAKPEPTAQPAPPVQPVAGPDIAPRPGTGAHGLEWREGKLWVAVPPSRTIYKIDPQNWIVEQRIPTSGNRPHGIGWEQNWLWCTDSNLNAFFKHDLASGEVVDRIQLEDRDPLPHGMTIWQGTLWYCDDVGVVCRLPLAG